MMTTIQKYISYPKVKYMPQSTNRPHSMNAVYLFLLGNFYQLRVDGILCMFTVLALVTAPVSLSVLICVGGSVAFYQ